MQLGVATLASLLALAGALALPRTARANGRFPATSQLVAAPTKPDVLVLRATFGILLSRDGGGRWDWVCEKAIGYSGQEDPAIGVTSAPVLFAGLFSGLRLSRDTGCTWEPVSLVGDKLTIDVTVRPDDARVVYALLSPFNGQTDAGDSLFENIVIRSRDEGASWSALGSPLDPSVLAQTLEVAASDPRRIYVSGVRIRGKQTTGVLLVSSDEGATWVERNVPLDPITEGAPYVAAVDPARADRLYIRNSGPGANRLFYSDDAGQSFKVAFTSQAPLAGFALSADGSKVWIGSVRDGLHMASTADMIFAKKSDVEIQCLASVGASLWACSNRNSGFAVGVSDDQGATFAPRLKLEGIRGPLECASTSGISQCNFKELQDTLVGRPPATDAGASADAGSPGVGPTDTGGCTCSSGRGGPWLGGLLCALGAAALRVRRRARSR